MVTSQETRQRETNNKVFVLWNEIYFGDYVYPEDKVKECFEKRKEALRATGK